MIEWADTGYDLQSLMKAVAKGVAAITLMIRERFIAQHPCPNHNEYDYTAGNDFYDNHGHAGAHDDEVGGDQAILHSDRGQHQSCSQLQNPGSSDVQHQKLPCCNVQHQKLHCNFGTSAVQHQKLQHSFGSRGDTRGRTESKQQQKQVIRLSEYLAEDQGTSTLLGQGFFTLPMKKQVQCPMQMYYVHNDKVRDAIIEDMYTQSDTDHSMEHCPMHCSAPAYNEKLRTIANIIDTGPTRQTTTTNNYTPTASIPLGGISTLGWIVERLIPLITSPCTIEGYTPPALCVLYQLQPIQVQDITWHQHSSFTICPDGSYYAKPPEGMESPSAWAFAVIQDDVMGECRFAGMLSGPVQTNADHSLFQGIWAHSCESAETAGMIWSLAWALSVVAHTHKSGQEVRHSFKFCYDNKQVGDLAGHLTMPHTCHRGLIIIRSLVYLLSSVSQVEFDHYHSHQGMPLNELADCAADNECKIGSQLNHSVLAWPKDQQWAALSHWALSSTAAVTMLPLIALNKVAPWSYPVLTKTRDAIYLPCQLNQQLCLAPSDVTAFIDRYVPEGHKIAGAAVPDDYVTLHIIQYNILTPHLGRKRQQRGAMWKIWLPYLRKHGYSMAGMQECRDSKNIKFDSEGFCIVASAGTEAGTHGCRLIFDTEKQFKIGDKK